jgi:hypothetical protein
VYCMVWCSFPACPSDRATILTKIPKQRMFFYTESFWTGRVLQAAAPPWDLLVILIANKRGKAKIAGRSLALLPAALAASLANSPGNFQEAIMPARPVPPVLARLHAWLNGTLTSTPIPYTRRFKRCVRSFKDTHRRLALSIWSRTPLAASLPSYPGARMQPVTDLLLDWTSVSFVLTVAASVMTMDETSWALRCTARRGRAA